MTSAHDGAHTPGSPGGHTAAGATPLGQTDPASDVSDDLPHTASGELDLQEAIHQVELQEHEVRPPTAGPLSNLLTAVGVLAFGVVALVGSLALGLGTPREPAAGLWPLMISVVIVALGLVLIATRRRTSDAEQFSRNSWLVLAGLATMIVFVAVIGVIGFEIPAALLAFVWLRFLGHESWRMSVVTSVAVVAAFYLLFVAALAVPIPHLF
jgi:putative tricarboxylic transport membrane protein